MRQLLVYLKDYKKECILAPLFKMLEAVFELLVPLVMAAVIDTGIAQKDTAYIIQMCFVMVLLGGVGLICSVTAQYFSAKAACGFGTKTRHALFAHIQKLSFTKLDQAGTSALITRMTSDVNQVQNGVNMVLRLFLRSPFIVLGAMVMAFTIDIKSAVYFVIAIPLLSVVVFAVMYISIPLYKKVQERLDVVYQRKSYGRACDSCVPFRGRRKKRISCAQSGFDCYADVCRKNFRTDESRDIFYCQWSDDWADLPGSAASGRRCDYTGRSCGSGELYGTDSCGIDQICKFDCNDYKGDCLRQSDLGRV